jgi:hypothetical protein
MSCVCVWMYYILSKIYQINRAASTPQSTRTRLQTGWPSPSGVRCFYLLENVQNQSGAQPVSYSTCTWGFFLWEGGSSHGIKLTVHLHLLPVCGGIHLHLVHASMAGTGKTFHAYCQTLLYFPSMLYKFISCRCLRTKKCTKKSHKYSHVLSNDVSVDRPNIQRRSHKIIIL